MQLCHFGSPRHTTRDTKGVPHTLTRSEISANFNHSRTSKKFARKSNYSRTYAKTGGWGLTFELSTGHPANDAHPERAARAEGSLRLLPLFSVLATRHSSLFAKSNHSRTYAPVARKSNYSRTYEKQGGGGRYLYGNVLKICRRADILVLLRNEQKEPKSTGRSACATRQPRRIWC
jgi:hypothetical protein